MLTVKKLFSSEWARALGRASGCPCGLEARRRCELEVSASGRAPSEPAGWNGALVGHEYFVDTLGTVTNRWGRTIVNPRVSET